MTLAKLPVAKISSAAMTSSHVRPRSMISTPAARRSAMTRCLVMPLRNAPFGAGVCRTPPEAMKMLAVANSATLPQPSSMTQLSKPARCASAMARAELG